MDALEITVIKTFDFFFFGSGSTVKSAVQPDKFPFMSLFFF
jgi:hypothetical protein